MENQIVDSENDKLVEKLNQIKQDFEKNLESIEQIKQESDAKVLSALEAIEKQGWQTVIEIEDLQKRIGGIQTDASHKKGGKKLGLIFFVFSLLV